jgi:hypothetical protein
MCKEQIMEYLKNELADLRKELNELQDSFNNADHLERIGMCIPLDKMQDKYYHFWMVCNDLGVIEAGV